MRTLPLVDLDAVYAEIGDELEAAVLRVCRSRRYVGGEEVERFEQEFARYLGVRHVAGVGSGTDALELSLRAVGVGPGQDVLLPANTFVATAEAITAAGARPRFVDVELDSGLVDLSDAERRLTSRTRAIVPVHLYGRMADMAAVLRFAERHDLAVVEDAAQAHGARCDGRRAGAVGHAGCFSFYPSKNLGALGEAGAVATDDDALAERIRLLRDHGRAQHDVHVVAGRNSRLDPIQAAVLRVKLQRLDDWTQARRKAAERLRDLLAPELLDWRADDPDAEVHHLFPILVDARDELAARLRANGIATGVHYRCTVPETPAFHSPEQVRSKAAERARRQLSLPMHPYLTVEDTDHIAASVNDIVMTLTLIS